MAYIPGAGIKKPLNPMSLPVRPNIKKGPPRFQWSRKHWRVDEGETSRNITNGNIQNFVGDAVLLQSRNYNKQRYGIRSHRDYVDEFSRPPIQTIEDIEPLSRQRRKPVWGRINPYVEWFQQDNKTIQDQGAYLTDRIKGDTQLRPTYIADVGGPVEHKQVARELKPDLPQYSVVSGYNPEYQEKVKPLIDNDKFIRERISVGGISGNATYLEGGTLEAPLGTDYVLTDKKRTTPYVSKGDVGYGNYGNKDPMNIRLEKKLPTASVLARVDIGFVPGVIEDLGPEKRDYSGHTVALSVRPDTVFKDHKNLAVRAKNKKMAFTTGPGAYVSANLPPKDIKRHFINPKEKKNLLL